MVFAAIQITGSVVNRMNTPNVSCSITHESSASVWKEMVMQQFNEILKAIESFFDRYVCCHSSQSKGYTFR